MPVIASAGFFIAEVLVAIGTATGRIRAGRGVLALLAINRIQTVLTLVLRRYAATEYDRQVFHTADVLRRAVSARETERAYKSPRNVPAGPCAVHSQPIGPDGICPACRVRNRDTGGLYLRRRGVKRSFAEIQRQLFETQYVSAWPDRKS